MARRIILSVEDDGDTYHLIETAFREAAPDFELQRAHDGDEALTMLQASDEGDRPRPDLILTNLNLPKRNGFELLKEMRKGGLVNSIPVVVFSSSSSAVTQKRPMMVTPKPANRK
jgi:DNA-binding response OmpR family regulator